ncbi:MAG: hypothetical protein ACOYON_02110 [Fimbriimonas sp.]
MRSLLWSLALVVCVAVAGCQGGNSKEGTLAGTTNAKTVELGMDVAVARSLMGEPDDFAHVGGSDIYTWKDKVVTFEGGKATKIEPK